MWPFPKKLPPREQEILAGLRARSEQTAVYFYPPTKLRIYFRARLERGDASFEELDTGLNAAVSDKPAPALALAGQLGTALADNTTELRETLFPDGLPVVVVKQPRGNILVALRSAFEQGFPILFAFDLSTARYLSDQLFNATEPDDVVGDNVRH